MYLLAFFPAALFFSAFYTEALFLALTAGALYLARTGRWGASVRSGGARLGHAQHRCARGGADRALLPVRPARRPAARARAGMAPALPRGTGAAVAGARAAGTGRVLALPVGPLRRPARHLARADVLEPRIPRPVQRRLVRDPQDLAGHVRAVHGQSRHLRVPGREAGAVRRPRPRRLRDRRSVPAAARGLRRLHVRRARPAAVLPVAGAPADVAAPVPRRAVPDPHVDRATPKGGGASGWSSAPSRSCSPC